MSIPVEEVVRAVEDSWGTGAISEWAAPDASQDPAYRRWFAMTERVSLSPRDAGTLTRFVQSLDVREALASVRVPTLILHRQGSKPITPDQGHYLSEHIAGARFVLLPGNDMTLYAEPASGGLHYIEDS
jgi:pimeloyl-ACP methyl ester carboxylesterase